MSSPVDQNQQLEKWRKRRQQRQKKHSEAADEWGEVDSDPIDEIVVTAAQKRKRDHETALLSRKQQNVEENKEESPQPNGRVDTDDNETTLQQSTEQQDQEEETKQSLFEKAAALHHSMNAQEREQHARQTEEDRILKEASKIQTNALQAAQEVAHSTTYTKPMPSSWTAPRHILKLGEAAWEAVRDALHMHIQGQDVPPPLKRFADMKFPRPILAWLKQKKISSPTPIQMQGLPVALAGRDMVGIAFTGSGKTLTFTLPLVMAALEEELRMPLQANEGPIGIILAPSRELARQTYDLCVELCTALSNDSSRQYPQLRSQLFIGGESVKDQLRTLQTSGIHCVVATPGRLRDVLKRRAMNLLITRYICLDEADRMLDMGFDEEVGEIMNYFSHQRQTLLFSATFPKKFQDFARTTLVQPIVVNVGRAGAANLDVVQEVEYVKEEAKIVYLLHCLQKTAPPVIIFCERSGAVDDIHEYLLLKGVEAVSIHGGKDQEERNEAIKSFKQGTKDVLIANDIAAKGLDFPNIQHVINYDMPAEIENYVHRIGRTGRAGKTGVATTFINKSCNETTLLDLKALLREAKQRIPPVLEMLEDPRDQNNGKGCSFCGGLGHSVVDCPKIDKDARRVAGNKRDVLTGGGDW